MHMTRPRVIFVLPKAGPLPAIDDFDAATDVVTFDALAQDIPHGVTVACWLFCQTYDAHDVITKLTKGRYRGTVRCYAHGVRDPAMIAAELSQITPDIRVQVILTTVIDPDALRHLMTLMP